jgi:nucleoside diphosphate kinase
LKDEERHLSYAMDHLQTGTDLASGRVTLLIFMPDAIESHLVGSIERWVRARTACAPIARRWFSHTEETLERFYPGVAEHCSEENWHLLASVFSAGPCLATLWLGEGAARSIPSVKGQTHPARCAGSTLRGSFWCDNPVSNLVHVSDDGDEVGRELGVLRSIAPDLFVGHLPTRGLDPFLDPGPPAPRHSGILTLCSLVQNALATRGSAVAALDVPESGVARETMQRAEAWLSQARTSALPALAEAVESYLNGTANASRFIRTMKDAVPVGRWEELMLRCGILSRPGWLDAR